MKKQLALLVAGFVLAPGAAHAGMVKVASNTPSGSEMYVDSGFEYVGQGRNLIRLNMVTMYGKDQGDDRKKGSRRSATTLLNCSGKTLRIEKMTATSPSGATEFAVVFPPERIKTDTLSEGTLMWTMQDIVCSTST